MQTQKKTWQDDAAKSAALAPEVNAILRQHLPSGTQVMRRIRFDGTAKRYGGQFTLRSSRQSGTDTELQHVLVGDLGYYFYGHATNDGKQLERWVLLDLGVFRQCHQGRGKLERNYDYSSGFMIYELRDFPASLIVAQGELVNPKRAKREAKEREKAAQLAREEEELEQGRRAWAVLEDLCE